MAALDGELTIGIDYRPCIVTETNWKRALEENKPVKKHYKALFHCWSHRSEVIGESCLRGGHPAGQVSSTFAIVEFEDGTVHEVKPWNVRFIDNAMSEYVFPEMEDN